MPPAGRLGEGFVRVRRGLERVRRATETALRVRLNVSDHSRWADPQALDPDWDSRTQKLASLIEPQSSVIEFGAGRLALRRYLPDGCTYTPSDIVDRGNGTIVCDLNARSLPAFPPHDVAVFGGVLEYVQDVPRLIRHVSASVRRVIASYAVTDDAGRTLDRRANGWVNDFDSSSFVDMFQAAGFTPDRIDHWGPQLLGRFVRRELLSRE